jgi:hypothetical protein
LSCCDAYPVILFIRYLISIGNCQEKSGLAIFLPGQPGSPFTRIQIAYNESNKVYTPYGGRHPQAHAAGGALPTQDGVAAV